MRFVDSGCILMMLIHVFSAREITSRVPTITKMIETSGNGSEEEEFEYFPVDDKPQSGQQDHGLHEDKDKSVSGSLESMNFKTELKLKDDSAYNEKKDETEKVKVDMNRYQKNIDAEKGAKTGKHINTFEKEGENVTGKLYKRQPTKEETKHEVEDKKTAKEGVEEEKKEDINENSAVNEKVRNDVDNADGRESKDKNLEVGNVDDDGKKEQEKQERDVDKNNLHLKKSQESKHMGSTADTNENMKANKYLKQFGYMDNSNDPALSIIDMSKAIKKFQKFAQLKVTGELNSETLRQMEMPRCGVTDMDSGKSVLSYKIYGSKWKTNELTYKILNTVQPFNRSIITSTIKEAFELWEEESALTFHEIFKGTADIEISFGVGYHGDQTPFDGPGGVLAHAYLPPSGDVHLDGSESWTVNSSKAYSILKVTAHEFGHSIGLLHSKDTLAVMYPFYSNLNVGELKLGTDDIRGIQKLYGPPNHTTTAETTDPTSTHTTSPPQVNYTTSSPQVNYTTSSPQVDYTTNSPQVDYTTSSPQVDYTTSSPQVDYTTSSPQVDYTTSFGDDDDDDLDDYEAKMPCPFYARAIMYRKKQFYLFYSGIVFKLTKNGLKMSHNFESNQRGIRHPITAAVYNNDTDETYLFRRRQCYRVKHGVLDRSFKKFYPQKIRLAVAVRNMVLAFSFDKVYFLNQTMDISQQNYISEEFPDVTKAFRSAYSVDGENIVFLKKRVILKTNYATRRSSKERCVTQL